MYAVICSPQYWKEIEEVVTSKGDQILISSVKNSVDINIELENVERLPITHIILDITVVQEKKQLLKSISRYRILHEETQIVIIAPDFKPGDKTLHSLVTMNVYNIIAPSSDIPGALKNTLTDVLNQPYTYKKAVKWLIYDDNPQIEPRPNVVNERSENKQVFKELVGTITIAVSSLQHGSGATYNALTIAKFLANQDFRVAVVELKQKNDYSLIYLPRKETYSSYHYRYEKFDIFANDGETTSDELFIAAISKNYQYLILDTGLIFKYDINKAALDKPETQIKKYEKGDFYNDFMKSDIKIINSFASTQFADSIEYLMNYINVWSITDLNILFNFSDQERIRNLKKISESAILLEPYNPSKVLTEEQEDFYNSLLERVIPKSKSKKGGMGIGNMFKSLVNR